MGANGDTGPPETTKPWPGLVVAGAAAGVPGAFTGMETPNCPEMTMGDEGAWMLGTGSCTMVGGGWMLGTVTCTVCPVLDPAKGDPGVGAAAGAGAAGGGVAWDGGATAAATMGAEATAT